MPGSPLDVGTNPAKLLMLVQGLGEYLTSDEAFVRSKGKKKVDIAKNEVEDDHARISDSGSKSSFV